ncbi:hypothetical protein N7G274_004227 [Stereocaulon virgatum]|uniref:Chitin-binding type-1 domain-containing protein n=1 Tax=Stereocaulon virgatum TaxID=373712 RepID=A0ABR4ABB5_9LECA
MKSSLYVALTISVGHTFGNIPVNYKVTLSCNHSSPYYTGCLRGMQCVGDEICVKPAVHPYPPSVEAKISYRLVSRSVNNIVSRGYSRDGQCGPNNGGLTCDPDSTTYSGTCCSSHGWCGGTADYCGAGCTSGCTTVTKPPRQADPPTAPRTDGRCGSDFGGSTCDANGPYGGCCSHYGYCGSTAQHCLFSNGCQNGCTPAAGTTSADATKPTSSVAASGTQEPVLGKPSTAPSTGPVTTDGTCGAGNGNTVCGNWPQGACCSLYGFCGKTTAHCGSGCQSGPCVGPPDVPVPGPSLAPAAPNPGDFKVVGQSGVPAMHAGLLPNGRVIFLDKVENYTQIRLSNGQYAYSAEYDPATNTVVGLQYATNAFCSGGAFLADGRWLSLGGNAPLAFIDPTVGDGFTAIRYLSRSSTDASLDGSSWSEPGNKLSSARWYATAQTMPDGSVFVASGSRNGLDPTIPANNNPTYEILNPEGISSGKSVPLEILGKNQPYYMYPFVHLLNNGDLFIFVAKSAEIFRVAGNQTITTLPDLGGDFRTYPNTGSSVLLPLSSANDWAAEIVICGGGAYQDITSPTDASCGSIQPLSGNPTWTMESMPEGRGMVEATLLPDGTVIWVNGCNQGAQGFGLATAPTLEALIYDPTKPVGQRFSTGASSTIARL